MTIRIHDGRDTLPELERDFQRLDRRTKSGRHESRIVRGYLSVQHIRQFLTPQRQFLYRVLRRKEVGSVYELAKMLGRPYKAVSDDLKVLQEMTLIRLETQVHNGRARSKPVLTHKKLVIEFS